MALASCDKNILNICMCLVTGRNRFFFFNFTSLFSNRHQLTNKPDAYGALTGSFSAAGHRPLYKNSNRI